MSPQLQLSHRNHELEGSCLTKCVMEPNAWQCCHQGCSRELATMITKSCGVCQATLWQRIPDNSHYVIWLPQCLRKSGSRVGSTANKGACLCNALSGCRVGGSKDADLGSC